MQKIINTSTVVVAMFGLLFVLNSCDNNTKTNTEKPIAMEQSQQPSQDEILRHVVMFEFNDKATAKIVKEIEQQFAGLADKISEIHAFEWGSTIAQKA